MAKSYYESNGSICCLNLFLLTFIICQQCLPVIGIEQINSTTQTPEQLNISDAGRILNNNNNYLADDTRANDLIDNNDKNKTINWTLVEEQFNQYLSDEEILQKWETMEANMKAGLFILM